MMSGSRLVGGQAGAAHGEGESDELLLKVRSSLFLSSPIACEWAWLLIGGPAIRAGLLSPVGQPVVQVTSIDSVRARPVFENHAKVVRLLQPLVAYPGAHLVDRLLAVAGEAQQDGLDQAGVIEELVTDVLLDARPDDQRRNPHAIGLVI